MQKIKQPIIFIFLCVLTQAAYATNTFKIKGKLEDCFTDQPYRWRNIEYVSLSYMRHVNGEWQEVNADSVDVIDDNFFYTGEIDGLTAVKIWCGKECYPVTIYVEPNNITEVTLYADKSCHFRQNGTDVDKEQECFNNYIYERDSINDDILKYYYTLANIKPGADIKAYKNIDLVLDDLYAKRKKSLAKRNKEVIEFVKLHPYFNISPALLYQVLETDRDELSVVKELYPILVCNTINSQLVQLLEYKIEEAELIKICKDKVIGVAAPDFNATTLSGENIRLKDLQGRKYVILCKDYIPDGNEEYKYSYIAVLKDIYKKYKNKGLEVIVLSNDFDTPAWNAITKQCDWKFIKDFRLNRNTLLDDQYISDKYPIQVMPCIFFINKDRNILAKWERRDFEESMRTFIEKEFETLE